jgi:hypothetical protein
MRELKTEEIELVSRGSETCATNCKQTSTGVVCVTICWPTPLGGGNNTNKQIV